MEVHFARMPRCQQQGHLVKWRQHHSIALLYWLLLLLASRLEKWAIQRNSDVGDGSDSHRHEHQGRKRRSWRLDTRDNGAVSGSRSSGHDAKPQTALWFTGSAKSQEGRALCTVFLVWKVDDNPFTPLPLCRTISLIFAVFPAAAPRGEKHLQFDHAVPTKETRLISWRLEWTFWELPASVSRRLLRSGWPEPGRCRYARTKYCLENIKDSMC